MRPRKALENGAEDMVMLQFQSEALDRETSLIYTYSIIWDPGNSPKRCK